MPAARLGSKLRHPCICLHVNYIRFCFGEVLTYQGAHNESGVGSIVVDAGSDQVELLVRASLAGLQVDRDQVLAEVSRSWVDEQTLPIGSLQ